MQSFLRLVNLTIWSWSLALTLLKFTVNSSTFLGSTYLNIEYPIESLNRVNYIPAIALPSWALYCSPEFLAARSTRERSRCIKSSFGLWLIKFRRLCVLNINELTRWSIVSSFQEVEKCSRLKDDLFTSRSLNNSIKVRQSRINCYAPRLGNNGKMKFCC